MAVPAVREPDVPVGVVSESASPVEPEADCVTQDGEPPAAAAREYDRDDAVSPTPDPEADVVRAAAAREYDREDAVSPSLESTLEGEIGRAIGWVPAPGVDCVFAQKGDSLAAPAD